MPPSPCPLCRSAATTSYCVKDGYEIARCGSCRNGFIVPPAGDFSPEELYKRGYHRNEEGAESSHGYDDYFAMAPAFRKTFAKRLREILQASGKRPGTRRLLDVGCGPGFFLELAREYFQVTGVELGTEAVAYAREKLGLDVREGKFQPDMYPDSSFSVVTLFDTLEHLPEPIEALRGIRRVLEDGGVLMLSTGDFSSLAALLSGTHWHLLTVPEHLFYFTRRGLTDLLMKEGFDVLNVRYPANHFTADYLAERLIKSLGFGRAYLGRRGARRFMNKLIVPMNLFDVMLLTVRKRRAASAE